MSKTSRRDFLKKAAATLAVAGSSSALASENPFGFAKLEQGYENQIAHNHMEGKCGEGKCGGSKDKEGKCGGSKDKEGKCGGSKAKEGKCGEGKCGGSKPMEGKCGEGKCGAS